MAISSATQTRQVDLKLCFIMHLFLMTLLSFRLYPDVSFTSSGYIYRRGIGIKLRNNNIRINNYETHCTLGNSIVTGKSLNSDKMIMSERGGFNMRSPDA